MSDEQVTGGFGHGGPNPNGGGHGDPGGYSIADATSKVEVSPELRALAADLKALETNVILARMAFARSAGMTYDNRRDMYGVLGYRDLITTSDYRSKYERGGIAGRIVDTFPNATWRGGMEVIEDDSKDKYTPFEQAWADFDKRLQVQAKFRRVDVLAGLSTYSVLLIGAGDADLEQELPRGKDQKQILYLQPYLGGGGPQVAATVRSDKTVADGADATVYAYDDDPKSARFGLPQSYNLKRTALGNALPRPVHWSRIIHVAEGLLDDEVFGLPALERVWNLIEDLEKITGGGSEAFWLRANQGIHIDVDKDMSLEATKDTVAALKEQMEAYKHQLTRAFRTRGTTIETLGSDVANFGPNADSVLTQIAGSKSIPKRILTGSEMGELASSQDRDNWKDQVNGRQTQYAGPYIVRQLVDRLIQYGYLPPPIKGADAYEVKWSHIQTLTEQEKADGAQKWAATNQTQGELVFTDAEIRDKWYGMGPLTDEQRQEVADRKAEEAATAMKQQQEAMKATAALQPAIPQAPEKIPPQLVKAATAFEPQAGDDELVRVLAEALASGNAEVVASIIGLSDIAPVHRVNAPGSTTALCGERVKNDAFATMDAAQVTCAGCLAKMDPLA